MHCQGLIILKKETCFLNRQSVNGRCTHTLHKGENQPGLGSTAIVHSVHITFMRHTYNNFSTFVYFKNSLNIASYNPFNNKFNY